jgi:hypothetical protein
VCSPTIWGVTYWDQIGGWLSKCSLVWHPYPRTTFRFHNRHPVIRANLCVTRLDSASAWSQVKSTSDVCPCSSTQRPLLLQTTLFWMLESHHSHFLCPGTLFATKDAMCNQIQRPSMVVDRWPQATAPILRSCWIFCTKLSRVFDLLRVQTNENSNHPEWLLFEILSHGTVCVHFKWIVVFHLHHSDDLSEPTCNPRN